MLRLWDRFVPSFAVVVLLLLVVFVQAALSEDVETNANYGWFFTRSKHINQLLQAGEIGKASAVWNKEEEYFRQSQKEGDKKCTDDLADALEESLSRQARQKESALLSVKWPETLERWPAVKLTISGADEFVQEVGSHQVLVYSGRADRITQCVVSAKEKLVSTIRSKAPEEFLAYKGVPGGFFAEYPLELQPSEFLKTNKPAWLKALSNGACDEIKIFAFAHSKWLDKEDLDNIGKIFLQKTMIRDKSGKATLAEMLAASRRTLEAGFTVTREVNTDIRVVKVTNTPGMKDDGIEFPVDIDVDLPITAAPISVEKTGLDAILSKPAAAGADILILFNATTARTDRKLEPPETVTSKFESGTRRVPNPDYARQVSALRQMEMIIQIMQQNARANQATCSGFNCLVYAAQDQKAITQALAMYAQANAKLNATPMTLEESVYTSYEFNKTVIDAVKVASISYYIIDRVAQTYLKGTFDARQGESFTVCYGLKKEDPDRTRYLAASHEEEDVERFEQSSLTAPLSKILEQAEQQKAGPVPMMTSLRNEIMTDANSASKAARRKSYTAALPPDMRFDSVVVVLSPGGSLGSGFFVKDDVVLTNYHVIKDSKFVEMRLHDGSETFGKIIGQDARRDLALIKVQARGIPVKIYNEQTLILGGQVEAIGHPEGLEFSVTKGVVSGIREFPSRFAPGGKKVRFIQTDTAINPGNSGGPLYFGDRVVGVNTWKVVAVEIGGLNFAVHYAEVLEFLEVNGIATGR